MPKPVEVKPLSNYRIWLRYDDGTEGEGDLSDLAGRGVFKAWTDAAFFGSVRVGSHGAIQWGPDIDLCPDAMYLRLTRKSPVTNTTCHSPNPGPTSGSPSRSNVDALRRYESSKGGAVVKPRVRAGRRAKADE